MMFGSRLLLWLGALLPYTCAQAGSSATAGSELAEMAAVLPACGVSPPQTAHTHPYFLDIRSRFVYDTSY